MKTATATTIPADEAPALKLAEDDAPALIGDATAFEVDQATERDIPTRDISPSPYNPRKHFDPDELVKLGQSLRAHGQMQNLVVRPHPRPRKGSTVGYEIIAGERRWQAATLAKLPTMRCRIVQVDDAQAIELAGMENYSRQQLNAIEEAHWFRAMIDKAGYTQEQLAQRLGITQGQVSNRLRLIELPEAWQQRVISGEMPATWLRELAPWAKRPGVLDHLAKEIADDAPNSLDEFRRQLRSAVEQCSRPLSGWYRYHSPSGYRSGEVAFRATSKQREKLDVIEVDGWRGKEPRAFNVAYWGELQAAGEQRRAARSNGAARPADRAAPTNPAEAKRLAAAKVKKAADQLARRVDAWRVAWLQQRIAERLPTADDGVHWRLLLHFVVADVTGRRAETLRSLAKDAGGKIVQRGYARWDVMRTLDSLTDEAVRKLAIGAISLWATHNTEGWNTDVRVDDVEYLADTLGVDLAKEWRLTRDFLELFTSAQLLELAREWAIKPDREKKRGELIDLLMGGASYVRAPKCLLNGKTKGKKR